MRSTLLMRLTGTVCYMGICLATVSGGTATTNHQAAVGLARHVKVFVLTGQSNSLGVTADPHEKDKSPGENPLDARIPFFWANRSTRAGDGPAVLYGDSGGNIVSLRVQQGEGANPMVWGPEIAFGRGLAAAGVTNILIVKASRGGGGNTHWVNNAKGQMYKHIVQTVGQAVAALPAGTDFDIVALLYVQGETDTEGEAKLSGQRLRQLAQNLRKDLPHAENMKVLVGGITAAGASRDIVRAQQSALPAIDPTFRYIDAIDLRSQLCDDQVHLNKSAKLELGRRMADVWLAWTKADKN